MPAPTKSQVKNEAIQIISTFTTLSPADIDGKYVLKSPPMLIDNIGLGFLAESLRGYIKQYTENTTIKAKELRKSGLTVNSVISMIQERVEAK